jgi:hypothetical protein
VTVKAYGLLDFPEFFPAAGFFEVFNDLVSDPLVKVFTKICHDLKDLD